MVASVLMAMMLAMMLISRVNAFRLHSHSAGGGSENAMRASAPYPMNAPVLIRSHRHRNLKDENCELKLTFNSDSWEQWVISDAGNGTVTIKSHRSQHLQDNGGKVKLSKNAEEWEQWTISSAGSGKVTIKSHRNQYLQDYSGQVKLTGNKDEWEEWSILDPTKPDPSKSESAVTVLSYNLMSWCTQGNCRGGRMKVIAEGIRRWKPAVLGTQEHGDHNAPYDKVRSSLSPTGLTHRGAGTYYDASVVEPVGNLEEIAIYKTYRYVSGQVYKIKACSGSNCEFAFYNTHWDHGSHDSQANEVIAFMNRHSGGRPKVLTGDFNVWGSKSAIDKIKKSLDLTEASVPDEDTWCTGGKVDFILASRSAFARSGAITDANNCATSCDGCSYKGSDHKILKVDLTPV